jgi:hypothetical protein
MLGTVSVSDLDSSVGIKRLAMGRAAKGSDQFRGPPNSLSNGYQGLFPRGQNGRGMKLTTRFHLMALVRKRTIRTERPPLVGKVTANFCGYSVLRGSATNSHGR